MSRIILTRHSNREEHITVGYDRPLKHFWWSVCDIEGESVEESFMDYGWTPRTVRDLVNLAANHSGNVYNMLSVADKDGELTKMLEEHQTLEYPESNVVVDLSN